MVCSERDKVTAREHQTDGHRNKPVLHGRPPACAAKALPDPRNGEGEHARGPANGRSRHHRTRQARYFPADQADNENIRPGRRRRLAAILRPMATTRPAAAAETPRNRAETAGRWPYWV